MLDPSIEIFWTGEKVCSKSYTSDHLGKIGQILGRKLLLWDNYPVNDGEKMCRFLHLRPFENRPAEISNHLSGHLINPMNQAWLSRIPSLTLAESYRQGTSYNSDAALERAALSVLGEPLSKQMLQDLPKFQDTGSSNSPTVKKSLYANIILEKNTPAQKRSSSGWTALQRDARTRSYPIDRAPRLQTAPSKAY